MTFVRAGLIALAFASSLYGQATYYVAPTGSDANPGTTRTHPWRTLARANDLRNGDTLLLAGGSTFNGSIHVRANNVSIRSYGTGRATIASGDDAAIDANGAGGLRISNLALRGTSLGHLLLDRSPGITITNTGTKLTTIAIDHVEISGYTVAGILFQATGRFTGFDEIAIASVTIHEIGYAGVVFYADERGAYSSVSIRHCDVSSVTGVRTAFGTIQGTGNAIVGQQLVGTTISGNVFHDNGTPFGDGGFAILLTRPLDVVIEENEIFNTRTTVDHDPAGAIDIDGGSTVRIRYNYTHDNDGPGIHLCSCSTGMHDVIVQHNISEDGIEVEGGNVSDGIAIFHNTIFGGSGTALTATGPNASSITNNVLLANGGTVADAGGSATFMDNVYYDFSSPLRLLWDGASFGTVASWGHDPQGHNFDPLLSDAGEGGQMFPKSLSDLKAYRITPLSPLIDAAIEMEGIGPRDYYGGVERTLFGSDIGAYEYTSDPYAPSLDSIAPQTVAVGDAIDVDVWLHDADGTSDTIVALVNAPPFATIKRVSGSHAIITLAPLAAGQTTITVRAVDETQLSDTKTFTVTATGGVRTRAVRH
jgi:hypothetical protein